MAETLSIPGGQAKVRNSLGVFLLAIVTLYVYYFVWYYKINRELRDFGRAHDDPKLRVEPAGALAAVTGGALLIIPPFISMWRTFTRIRRAEEIAGLEDRLSHAVGFPLFLLAAIFLPVEMPYVQSHLNRLWREVAAEDEKRRLGMRGEATAT
ncbi:MAG TPA: DUF4234 domain-containing protein [Gaiellaceae bacterium]|nr:DUF4234 domain-containing protein [Gaiellaceae bacterium]